MRITFNPYSYAVILKALKAYQATSSEEKRKVDQLIDTISNIISVNERQT